MSESSGTETTVGTTGYRPPRGLGVLLIVTGLVGLLASFELTIERIALLVDPQHAVACDVSILVQCSANMTSWQGSVFGFSNPILGLMMFPATLVVGVALVAGVRFPRWFMAAFNAGHVFAFGFVCWLITQSIFSLGTLCPWCMVTWSVVIPSFWFLTLYNLKTGNIPVPPRARAFFAKAYEWAWVLTVLSYFVVILLAQIELNAFNRLGL